MSGADYLKLINQAGVQQGQPTSQTQPHLASLAPSPFLQQQAAAGLPQANGMAARFGGAPASPWANGSPLANFNQLAAQYQAEADAHRSWWLNPRDSGLPNVGTGADGYSGE